MNRLILLIVFATIGTLASANARKIPPNSDFSSYALDSSSSSDSIGKRHYIQDLFSDDDLVELTEDKRKRNFESGLASYSDSASVGSGSASVGSGSASYSASASVGSGSASSASSSSESGSASSSASAESDSIGKRHYSQDLFSDDDLVELTEDKRKRNFESGSASYSASTSVGSGSASSQAFDSQSLSSASLSNEKRKRAWSEEFTTSSEVANQQFKNKLEHFLDVPYYSNEFYGSNSEDSSAYSSLSSDEAFKQAFYQKYGLSSDEKKKRDFNSDSFDSELWEKFHNAQSSQYVYSGSEIASGEHKRFVRDADQNENESNNSTSASNSTDAN